MQIIRIDQEIGHWGISASEIKRQLSEATGDIKVEINSPGGSVVEGIVIRNAFEDYNKGTIEFIIIGMAASMATYIMPKNSKVKAYDNAIFMIHNPWGGEIGDYRAMESRAIVLKSMRNIMAKSYIERTGKPIEDITLAMNNETYYFGSEILDNGFVDEIISTDKEKDSDTSLALAKEQFKGCIKNLETNAKNEDITQIAAHVKKCTGNCPISDNETLRVNSASAQIKNKKQEDLTMENSQTAPTGAEAQNAEALESARIEAIASERKRVSDIMALAGDSEVKAKAISDGLSVGDTAIALNKTFSEKANAEKTNFEAAANEVSEVNTEVIASDNESAEDKAWDDAVAKKYRGDK